MADSRQLELLAQLTERSAQHAGLYSLALRELGNPSSSELAAARLSVISHCVRELMLGASDILVDTPEPRPNPSSGSLAMKLPTLLAQNGSPDLRADQSLIPVPRAIAAAFADIVEASTKEAGRNQRNTAALVTGSVAGTHPSIRQWKDAYNFFLKWAHVDQHHDGPLPDDSTVRSQLRVVEDVLEVRMNLFFDNLATVEELLAQANATDGAES